MAFLACILKFTTNYSEAGGHLTGYGKQEAFISLNWNTEQLTLRENKNCKIYATKIQTVQLLSFFPPSMAQWGFSL